MARKILFFWAKNSKKSDVITVILTSFACFLYCATAKKEGGMVQWLAPKSRFVNVFPFFAQ